MSTGQLIALVLPLVAIQLGLMILALRDLLKPERRVVGDSKVVWAIVIVLGEMLGPIAYLLFGRRDA